MNIDFEVRILTTEVNVRISKVRIPRTPHNGLVIVRANVASGRNVLIAEIRSIVTTNYWNSYSINDERDNKKMNFGAFTVDVDRREGIVQVISFIVCESP